MLARCNDIDVAWFEAGRGEPLVLIHGLADDHRAWRRALPDLMLRHRVFMYDLRGHGETTLGRPEGTLLQLRADLVIPEPEVVHVARRQEMVRLVGTTISRQE